MLPGVATLPNERLTGVSSVSEPISNEAVDGPAATGFRSRPTTRPLVRVSAAPVSSASVFAPVTRLALPRAIVPPAPMMIPASAPRKPPKIHPKPAPLPCSRAVCGKPTL